MLVAVFLTIVLILARTKPMSNQELQATKNIEAKIDSAIQKVQGGSPMEGIFMLREVLEEEPDNVRAIVQMGMFSLQSGQYDKALSRFNKASELEPKNMDLMMYQGMAYAGLDSTEKAVEIFEKYKTLIDDQTAIKEVEQYIEQLKNK